MWKQSALPAGHCASSKEPCTCRYGFDTTYRIFIDFVLLAEHILILYMFPSLAPHEAMMPQDGRCGPEGKRRRSTGSASG